MQGGGLTQFAATVLNLSAWYRIKHQLQPSDEVEGWYAVTGSWSKKAAEEGARMGVAARKVFDGKKHGAGGKFTSIAPADEWDVPQLEEKSRRPAFVYYCDNETVDGVEFGGVDSETAFPFDKFDPAVPVVADMSSNFLSRPVDVSKYGIIYAGAQKNLGPAGVTLVIVREDLLGACDRVARIPDVCARACADRVARPSRRSRPRRGGSVRWHARPVDAELQEHGRHQLDVQVSGLSRVL